MDQDGALSSYCGGRLQMLVKWKMLPTEERALQINNRGTGFHAAPTELVEMIYSFIYFGCIYMTSFVWWIFFPTCDVQWGALQNNQCQYKYRNCFFNIFSVVLTFVASSFLIYSEYRSILNVNTFFALYFCGTLRDASFILRLHSRDQSGKSVSDSEFAVTVQACERWWSSALLAKEVMRFLSKMWLGANQVRDTNHSLSVTTESREWTSFWACQSKHQTELRWTLMHGSWTIQGESPHVLTHSCQGHPAPLLNVHHLSSTACSRNKPRVCVCVCVWGWGIKIRKRCMNKISKNTCGGD